MGAARQSRDDEDRVRIDWRREGEGEEYVRGVAEPLSARDRAAILSVNDALGWQKFRIVDVEDDDRDEHVEVELLEVDEDEPEAPA